MFKFIIIGLAYMLQRMADTYATVYTGEIDEAGRAALTPLKVPAVAVGLSYFVVEPIGTKDDNSSKLYMKRTRTIREANVEADTQEALRSINSGIAYVKP